jgi:hypothetical protein
MSRSHRLPGVCWKGRLFPDFVRRIPLDGGSFDSFVLVDRGAEKSYIRIAIWCCRPESYGILLCPRSLDPAGMAAGCTQEWKPGLYYWDYRPANSRQALASALRGARFAPRVPIAVRPGPARMSARVEAKSDACQTICSVVPARTNQK